MFIEKALQQTKIDVTEIEIFLSHVLGKDRSFIKAFPELKLNETQTVKLKEFIKRRSKHEPLPYILGYTEFCGLKFKIDKRAMIPRPETEELVRQVVAHIFSIPNRNRNNHWEYGKLTIADVGTGSGNIAISLAKAAPFAKIYAIEKDLAAISLAKENIRYHALSNQIEVVQGDLLAPLGEQMDIIVTNLPYIPRDRFARLQPEITRWEPRVALDGGHDGLTLYRKLFSQAPKVLKQNGLLFYEIDGNVEIKRFNEGPVVVF